MKELDALEILPPFEGVTPEQEERNRKAGVAGHAMIGGRRRQAKNVESLRKMVRSTRVDS
jgi:hypothetical protein